LELSLTYIIWKSALITLKNKGITWRDSHYALDELKEIQIMNRDKIVALILLLRLFILKIKWLEYFVRGGNK